jgi:hypothetical protein
MCLHLRPTAQPECAGGAKNSANRPTTIVIHRGGSWVMRFDLSDEEWSVLEPLMPRVGRARARTIDGS